MKKLVTAYKISCYATMVFAVLLIFWPTSVMLVCIHKLMFSAAIVLLAAIAVKGAQSWKELQKSKEQISKEEES